MSILQYLTTYAEPECSCRAPDRQYQHVCVIPAFDEAPSMLDGFRAAARNQRVLWIVVVNASEDRGAAAVERTRYLCTHLRREGETLSVPGITLGASPIGDLLVIDRVSEGHQLPAKQGVGLARKIGCDLALAWHQQGVIASPWIHCSDADVKLPQAYFPAADALAPQREIAGLSYAYWHHTEAASSKGRALELYEMSLRYYALGLAWAGSPYAFSCIGSTMAVRADAYHAVRGVPKRQAGEDFYLLNKIAKLGSVVSPDCAPIQIAQRPSQRTPFGTGPAMERIASQLLEGEEFLVYHPKSFALLREWLGVMDEFAQEGDLEIVDRLSHEVLRRALPLETIKRLREARSQCKTAKARRKRLRDWFDGFRTLKLIHALRDQGLADLPWTEAFDAAPFVPEAEPPMDLRQTMAAREATLAARERRILVST